MVREDILSSIFRVIKRRKIAGATEKDIKRYKTHLIRKIWKNSDKDFKETIRSFK